MKVNFIPMLPPPPRPNEIDLHERALKEWQLIKEVSQGRLEN